MPQTLSVSFHFRSLPLESGERVLERNGTGNQIAKFVPQYGIGTFFLMKARAVSNMLKTAATLLSDRYKSALLKAWSSEQENEYAGHFFLQFCHPWCSGLCIDFRE